MTSRLILRSLALVAIVASAGLAPNLIQHQAISASPSVAYADSSCSLGSGTVKHVIYIQFDNVHFTRDNPNVPSDLEQMPHLLNFMENYGTLLTNHHTPLIAHTANDILTSLTGSYPDNVGQPVANSFGYFDSSGAPHFASSFQYWTDPVSTIDTAYNLIDAAGKNTPAPWVPFTRAGCDVGAFGTADIELENTTSDIKTVFTNNGNPAPAAEAKADPNKAVADFEGVAVHCAATSSLCSSANGAEPDVLPQEPGGYTGFNGLFGAKYVNPAICAIVAGKCSALTGGTAVNDYTNTPVADSHGNPGFPGFNPTATQTLGYVAAMQEAGIPVTYSYIADAHDNRSGPGTFGPGEAGYVAQLKAYDDAFASFFSDLNAHGINQSNTLFVFTADENDHFVGGPPSPANCDGVTTPCTYSQIGEIDGSLAGLLNAEFSGIATAHPFSVHSDSAPNYYVNGNPSQTDQTSTRPLERAVGGLTTHNPYTGGTDHLTNYLAGATEMKLLHMVTSDPARTPTFTEFANPDYFLSTGAAACDPADLAAVPCTKSEGHSGFAWNHGDVSPDINVTWLGMVGPGVRNLGVDGFLWTDQTDVRPTMMALTGLRDDYMHDGRVITQIMWSPPKALGDSETVRNLGLIYKEINAPVGPLGLASLRISNAALTSGSSGDDSLYTYLDSTLDGITSTRNALAGQMRAMLDNAAFNGQAIDTQQAQSLIAQGRALLSQVNGLAASY